MSGIYSNFLHSVSENYTPVRTLKDSDRGKILLLRHNLSGRRFIFRTFVGSAAVYKKLLQIRCDHLPLIFEVAEENRQVAVLEEYVYGDNLAWLLEETPLSSRSAREYMLQICNAVWVLHSLGAVHRDIKPENIILRGDEAVLIDFDASRIHKSSVSSDTQVIGTVGYAAPEQFGFAQTDARSDIYSLGVLLNVMLVGEHPATKLARGRLGQIIGKCTMTNPAHRYQSVQQLMGVL